MPSSVQVVGLGLSINAREVSSKRPNEKFTRSSSADSFLSKKDTPMHGHQNSDGGSSLPILNLTDAGSSCVNPLNWTLVDSKSDARCLEFDKMVKKVKNACKIKPDLNSNQAKEIVNPTENNNVPFSGPMFGARENFKPLTLSTAWWLAGLIGDINPSNTG
jgi:hypothetical protein